MITENTLRLKLETTGDGQLKASLDGVNTQLVDVGASLQQVNAAARETAQAQQGAAEAIAATGESAEEAAARTKAMVRASLERADAEREAQASAKRTVTANTEEAASYQRIIDWQQRWSAGATRAVQAEALAEKAKENAAALEVQRAELAKLVGQIDPTVSALNKLDAQQAKLAAFRKSGVLGADDFKAYSAAIDASRARIGMAGEAMHSFSLNSSMARREMGRLVGDMASGNWGRFQQTSLTLANYTGLMGAAFSVTGAAILGAVGAVGLAVTAFVKGSAEQEEYNKQLILTGSIAGVTASDLAEMARSVQASTGSTQHAAAATLAQVVASGKFVGDQVRTVATAAEQLRDATGQAVGETIKQFVSLAGDPANALVKLNDQQHFLTLAVYDQIKALQDQGREQDAADLAERTYADAIASRTGKIKQNLGSLETAWNGVKTAAANAWDRMLNIGRAETDDDKLLGLQGAANGLARRVQAMQQAGAPQSGIGQAGVEAWQKELADLRTKRDAAIAAYHDEEHRQADAAAADRQTAATQEAQDAGVALARMADSYASAEVKRAREIAKAHGAANDAIAKAQKVQDADLRLQLIAQAKANEQAAIAGIEARDKKPRGAGHKADPMAALDRASDAAYARNLDTGNKSLDDEAQALRRIAAAGAEAIAKGADVATVQGKVAGAIAQTLQYYQRLPSEAARAAQAEAQYREAMQAKLDAYREETELRVASIGMGQREIALQRELIAVHKDAARDLEKLNRDRAQQNLTPQQYAQRLQDIRSFEAQRVQAVVDADRRVTASQEDWHLGARRALMDISERGRDMATGMANTIAGAFGDMEAAVVKFAQTGKFSLEDFASNFVQAVLKMELQALEAKAATAMLSWMGMGTSYGAEGSNTFNSQGFVSHVGGYAGGGAIRGEGSGTSDSIPIMASNGEYMQPASSHAYYGTAFMDAVRTKRLPRFASGGPISGSYGGAGGGAPPQIIVEDHNNNAVKSSSQQQADGRWITRLVLDTVSNDIARGGQTSQALQQRFGLQRRGVPVGS